MRSKGIKPKKKSEFVVVKSSDQFKHFAIPKLQFSRLIRAIASLYGQHNWQTAAISALQEAAESFLVKFFEDAYGVSQVGKRVTLQQRDIEFMTHIYFTHNLV